MRDKIHDINSDRNSVPPRGLTPRRLAAIVAGDISGYSRLMQIDEEGTHGRVKRIERDLIEPSIAEHHGRLVKTTGDGFIAIFDSPVEAVRCGIVIQQNMVGRNTSMPKHHWIEYRIGVNLGDVIIEADDVFGDGVNIATRLEGIADPGQVYISGGSCGGSSREASDVATSARGSSRACNTADTGGSRAGNDHASRRQLPHG